MECVDFNDFMTISQWYYTSLGMEPYKKDGKESGKLRIPQRLLFAFSFLNINCTIVLEIIYLLMALSSFSSFLEATALAPCVGFCILTEIKLFTTWNAEKDITNFMRKMKILFPKTIQEQKRYETLSVLKETLGIQKIYSGALMIVIWCFNLIALAQSLLEYAQGMPFIKRYGYFLWYPFEINTYWLYSLVYVHQIHAGHIAAGGSLAADLLLFTMVMHLCMHFECVARELSNMQLMGNDDDVKRLNKIVAYHQIILECSTVINDVFSFVILLNYVSSSFIICLVGFQATAGAEALDIFKYLLFLMFELINVLTICYIGEKLISSSSSVADASFNQDWHLGNEKYRKTILMIICRSQKPAIIIAKSFAVVSLKSFTKVLGTSYQFFALLRTMYNRQTF